MNKIGFIGSGNMAQAIINGIVSSELNKKYEIYTYDINKTTLNNVKKKYKVNIVNSNQELVDKVNILLLAVKPQNIIDALSNVVINEHKLIISILAGIPINKIQRLLTKKLPVVRVMPNTPALIGEGACGYAVSKEITKKEENLAKEILSSFCKVIIKFKEKDINSVTAISGSGPAYFFYFVEAMLNASKKLKIKEKDAMSLIIQTMIGAAKLLQTQKERPEILRQKVTSKGGTTEKAVNFMEDKKVKKTIEKALMLAKKRADELGRKK